jgi:hypothetical protein
MEMLGLKPGRPWAVLAELSEFGGVLTPSSCCTPSSPSG